MRLLPVIAASILMIVGLCRADTEVEGEVSGEWTREGSPYIVIDSTWVPEDQSLTIREGVEVQFEEGQGLYIFGALDATGTEEDSVRIRVLEGAEHWKGFRFYGRNRTEWNYASIICPDNLLYLDQNSTLIMNDCLVEARAGIFGDHQFDEYYGPAGCRLYFSYSIIRGGADFLTRGGVITARHTIFDLGTTDDEDPGFSSVGTCYRFTSCVVIGDLNMFGGYCIIDSCRFLRPPNGAQIGWSAVGPQGRMTESYIEGSAGVSWSEGRVTPFINNTVLGNFAAGRCSAEIVGCDIRGGVNLRDCGSISFRNSVLSRQFTIWQADTLSIDSCQLVYDTPMGYSFIHSGDGSFLAISRSIIKSRFSLSPWGELESFLDHNTFVFDSTTRMSSVNQYTSFTNNIIMTTVPREHMFFQRSIPHFAYNCVWGYDVFVRFGDYVIAEEPDSTNIIARPLIEWEGIIPNLTEDSPCIDAGDPEAPQDPDGTRTDIGAIFFDQRLNISGPVESGLQSMILNVEAFPNPFNNYLSVSISSTVNSPVSVKLYDIIGRVVSITDSPAIFSRKRTVSLNAASLPSGRYVLLVSNSQYARAIPVYCTK